MQKEKFVEIVETFIDPKTEVLADNNLLIFSINGESIEIQVFQESGDLFIIENDSKIPASKWIIKNLAKLDLLASRLIESIEISPYFVPQSAKILASLDNSIDSEYTNTTDTLDYIQKQLDIHSAFATNITYLTSDAGEGKTSLINELAVRQAQRFNNNETDWLFVPITLGGRHFLRFDDITVGALQNRYRFPFLYYKSFIALVKLGVIVPAFDGFEEMFVEGSSGEALSAMGILVSSLESQGAAVIAARNAYFEFEDLKSTEKLYNNIKDYSVNFSKVGIQRWEKKQFVAYCEKRSVKSPSDLYLNLIEKGLNSEHPLITRAVLVKNLIDLYEGTNSLDTLLRQIKKESVDYFSVFVKGLIQREADEKWIDRSGAHEIGSPLLSVEEHIELLAQIALSMWESRLEYIKKDNLAFVTEYFSELIGKNPHQTLQVKDRIEGHAMLVSSIDMPHTLAFDHEEFRNYFLGVALANQISSMESNPQAAILSTLRRGILSQHALNTTLCILSNKKSIDIENIINLVISIAQVDSQTSFTHENCGYLISELLHNFSCNENIKISNMLFTNNSFKNKHYANITFENCFFSLLNLDNSIFQKVVFEKCSISNFQVHNNTKIENSSLSDCKIDCFNLNNISYWEPSTINYKLHEAKFKIQNLSVEKPHNIIEPVFDDDLKDFDKLVRYFMRSTHMGESIIRMKLSDRSHSFIEKTLPILLKNGILYEISDKGGDQRRFKLGLKIQTISEAISKAQGNFENFINYCKKKEN